MKTESPGVAFLKLDRCKKIITAVYLACEDSVADDISRNMRWLIESYEESQNEVARLGAENEKMMAVDYWADRYKIAQKELEDLRAILERPAAVAVKALKDERDELAAILKKITGDFVMQGLRNSRLIEALERIDASGTMSPMDSHETLLLVLKEAREALAEFGAK